MDTFIYIFIFLMALYLLTWLFEIIYLIHPFKFLAWFYHRILGWHKHKHKPDKTQFNDGCSFHSHCRFCGKEIMQDSQGNWFTFD